MNQRAALRIGMVAMACLMCAGALVFSPAAEPQTAANPALVLAGDVPHPLQFSMEEFAEVPHVTVNAYNGHDKTQQKYEGVLLRDLLKQAGVPQGEALRGKWVNCFVEMEAADGYKVVFALAEFDTSFQDYQVIVADKMDGAALGKDQGPLKLVAPQDKRPGRWIRQLQKITVRQAAP
jgi:hypothetical protein